MKDGKGKQPIRAVLRGIALLLSWNCAPALAWDGGGANDDWSTPENWIGDMAPGNPTGSTLIFNGTMRLTPNVDAAWEVGGIAFASGAGAFVLGGAALTIGADGIVVNSTSSQTVQNAVALSASQTWNATAGNLTHGGSLSLGGSTLNLYSAAARLIVLNGSLSGSGGIQKSGGGSLVLSGNNTFSGDSTLTAGQVVVASDQGFGTGSLILGGAGVQASGNRTFSNATRVNASTTFASGGTIAFTGNFVLASNPTLTVSTAQVTLNGGLSETGGTRNLTKAGTGSLIIHSNYHATGTLRINAGTTALGPGVTPPSANLWLAGGVLSMSGSLSRAVGAGAGQVRWSASGGFAAYGGNLTVAISGTPVWGTTASFLSATQQLLLSSAVADAVVDWTGAFSLGAAGNRSISVSDNTLSAGDRALISGLISGSGNLLKLGTGRLDLTNNNTYSGFTHVTRGVLGINSLADAGSPSALGAGSSIRFGQGTTAGTLLYTGGGHSSNRTIQLTGTTGGGVIQAEGIGDLILTGNVSAATPGAKLLTLSGNSTANHTISGNLSNGSGTVALTKAGSGRWILSGVNTYSGNTTLSAGTLGLGSNAALGTGNLLLGSGTLASVGGSRTVINTTLINGNPAIAAGSDITFAGNVTNNNGNRVLTVNAGAFARFNNQILLSQNTANRVLTFSGAGDSLVTGNITNGPSAASGIAKSGTGMLVLSGNNTYSGNTTVSAGTVEIRSPNALGAATAPTIVAPGATLAANGSFTSAEPMRLAGTGVGGGGALRHVSGSVSFSSNVTLTAAASITSTAGTLTLTPPSGDAISGNFALTIGGEGDILLVRRYHIGTASLLKTGSGRLALGPAATSATSGNVTVAGGVLEINGSLAAGGNLLVQSGAVLAGEGAIDRSTTVAGTHAAGTNSGSMAGTQTFSSGLAYNSGSSLQWQLFNNTIAGPGTNFDQVLLSGGGLMIHTGSSVSLVFNGSGSSVDWSNSFWNSNRLWLAISSVSAPSGLFDSVSITADSLGVTLASARPGAAFGVTTIGNDIYVQYAIPEPSALALLAVGLLLPALHRVRTFPRKTRTPRGRA